jgi:hypothetical protein
MYRLYDNEKVQELGIFLSLNEIWRAMGLNPNDKIKVKKCILNDLLRFNYKNFTFMEW